MPVNDYRCPKHGVREIFFMDGQVPTHCEKCGSKLTFMIAPNQFTLGGDMSWLTEREKKKLKIQLGTEPESPQHLRKIEQRLKVRRVEKHEYFRNDSPRWDGAPPKVKLNKDHMHSLAQKAKRV